MSKMFLNGQSSQQDAYTQKYQTARVNILLVVVFTAINLFFLIENTDTYFLFSAFVPYFIANVGMIICGRFPEEYYTDGLEEMIFFDKEYFVVLLWISIALTFLYLLAWFMSNKNHVGWIIFSLVIFGLDTLIMLLVVLSTPGSLLEWIVDIIFHAVVIYSIIVGIRAHYKLKKLFSEEAALPHDTTPQNVEGDGENSVTDVQKTPNSYIIRKANKDVKHRVLLEAHTLDYNICYRRVKHTNELVINDNVYDEIEGVIEFPHTLKAWIDGHYIAAGYDGTHSFIYIDEEKIAKKLRLL